MHMCVCFLGLFGFVFFFVGKFVYLYIDNRAQISALFNLCDCCNLMNPIWETNLNICIHLGINNMLL